MNEEQNVNKLPKDWKWVKLGDILNVSSGKGLKVNSLKGGEYPVYGGNGFNGMHSEYLIEEPKLIIGRVGVKCGVMHITKPKSWVTDNALIVEPKVDVFDIKFLKLKLGYENLNKLSVSTAQPVISGSKIYAYEILLPPKSTQQQIVSKIEELFSEIDRGIEEIKTTQQQLKVYRQAVLKWAFEGKLTHNLKKGDELPEGWKLTYLSEVSSLITKGASPKWQGINYVNDPSQVLFVTSENVRENYVDVSEPKYLELGFNEKQKRSILRKGDVLLNIVGASIGRAAIYNLDFNANINQAVAVIRLKEEASNVFVSYYLNSNQALSYYNSNKVDFARANLSLADVSNIQLALPPVEEQQQIVQEIESRLSVCNKIEETITTSLKQAEALRQSILKKAFEGKLM